MTRAATLAAVATMVASAVVSAQRGQTGATGRAQGAKAQASVARSASCESNLGQGVKTQQFFCDVIVAATGVDSVLMEIPPHTGPSTLFFDLHPRFDVPNPDLEPVRAYQEHFAYVAVVGPTGDVIEQAAVRGEFRSPADLFDRLPGTAQGAFKVVAPGTATPVRVVIPANINAIGIVGLRVVIQNRFSRQAFPEPKRPVAIVSNWRIEYSAK